MIDNNGVLISVSVLKEAFKEDKDCEIRPHVLHLIQKFMRERKKNGKALIGDIKINVSKSNKDSFHRECFDILRDKKNKIGYQNHVLKNISSKLHSLKNASTKILIEPTIYSKKMRIVGEPDVILFSGKSTDILEFKNRANNGIYNIDELQVETYMTIFGKEDSSIIGDDSIQTPINEKCKSEVRGFLIYKYGKIKQVPLNDEKIIQSKTSKLLEEIRSYNSIYDLPLPKKCDPKCVNALYCKRRSMILYENIPTSSGRLEIESPVYRARA